MATIRDAPGDGTVSIHVVSHPYSPPVYPAECIDVIDAWCWSTLGLPEPGVYTPTATNLQCFVDAGGEDAFAPGCQLLSHNHPWGSLATGASTCVDCSDEPQSFDTLEASVAWCRQMQGWSGRALGNRRGALGKGCELWSALD